MSSRAQSRAPSQMSGLDVAGLLNRLVDRQHDGFQCAVQRDKEARAEAYQREQAAKAEASHREQQTYQREKEASVPSLP